MNAFLKRRKRDLKRKIAEAKITVPKHTMRFNSEARRWLRVYLNIGLQFTEHYNRTLERIKEAEDWVRRLTSTRCLAAEFVRKIQVAAVERVTLYGTEL